MLNLQELIADAESQTKRLRRTGGNSNVISSRLNSSSMMNLGRSRQIDHDAAMAGHYQGRTFSIIEVLVNRLAAQPIMVGRRLKKPGLKVARTKSLAYHIRNGNIGYLDVPKYVSKMPGTAENIEILDQHDIYRTLEQPNSIMTGTHLWQMTIPALEVMGRAYWIGDLNTEGDVVIMPTPPHWVTPKHNKEKDMLFTDYVIKPPNLAGEGVTVPGDSMARFFHANFMDPFATLSRVRQLEGAIYLDEQIQKAQGQSFRNQFSPSFGVRTGDPDGSSKLVKLEDHQRADMMMYLKQEVAGLVNHGLPMIFDSMIRGIEQIGPSNKDMDYQNGAEASKARLHEGFHVSPVIAGQVENANRASSVVSEHHFNAVEGNPYGVMLGQTMTKSVAPWYENDDEELVIWIEPMKPHDPEMRLKEMEFLSDRGWTVEGEARRTFGLGIRDDDEQDGGNRIRKSGFRDITDGDNGEPNPAPIGAEMPPEEDDEDDEAKAFNKGYHSAWTKQHDMNTEMMTKAMQSVLESQVLEVADALDAMEPQKSKELVDFVVNQQQWEKQVKEAVQASLTTTLVSGALLEIRANTTEKSAGKLPDRVKSSLVTTLSEIMGLGYWSGVTSTTKRKLKNIADTVVRTGGTLKDVVDHLRQNVHKIAKSRSKAIATTETTMALNWGAMEARRYLASLGIVPSNHAWLSMIDGKERDSHGVNGVDGTIVAIGENFTVGGHPARFPGDPLLPLSERANCRCSLVPVSQIRD